VVVSVFLFEFRVYGKWNERWNSVVLNSMNGIGWPFFLGLVIVYVASRY